MKKFALFVFCAVLVLPAVIFPVHAGAAPAQDGGTSFRDVAGKEWFLSEVRTTASARSAGKTVYMDRNKLEADDMGGIYSLTFREDQVSGMGAPNRYFAPYTAGSNKTLSIGNMASTLMMAFREPDGLKEAEYFRYLSSVTRWNLRNGKLELYSTDSNGAEAVLVFTVK